MFCFSANNAHKVTIITLISKVDIVEDTGDSIKSKVYKTSLLRCLGDCMEVFIQPRNSSSRDINDSKNSRNLSNSSSAMSSGSNGGSAESSGSTMLTSSKSSDSVVSSGSKRSSIVSSGPNSPSVITIIDLEDQRESR